MLRPLMVLALLVAASAPALPAAWATRDAPRAGADDESARLGAPVSTGGGHAEPELGKATWLGLRPRREPILFWARGRVLRLTAHHARRARPKPNLRRTRPLRRRCAPRMRDDSDDP